MKRQTNKQLLNDWIQKNGPDGISQLAVQSGVSASTIAKARCGIAVPKKRSTIDRLCKTLGVTEDDLFPIVTSKRGKAAS